MERGAVVHWSVEPLERKRRGLDERIALALPALRSRTLKLIERQPAGSRLRRTLLTRAVRMSYAATNRDDYEVAAASLDPAIEFYPPGRGEAGLGFDAVYRGPEGVVRFVKQWKSGFSQFRYEPREIADPGGRRFAFRLDMIGKALDSDLEVRDEYGVVVTFAEGRVIRQDNFYEWSEALEVLGT